MKKNTDYKLLGPVDSAFFYVDTPETPMNIGALTIFEGQLEFEPLLRLIDARIHQADLYQKRVVQTPLNLGQPAWVFDPEFAVANHVFHHTLHPPGSDEQLRQLAGHLVSGMLDRAKPLWEIHLINGLSDDRSAILFKIHHCMVDGLSAVELFTVLFDLMPETPPLPRKPVYDVPYIPDPIGLIRETVTRDIPHKLNVLGKLARDAQQLGAVLADKEKRLKALVGLSYLINDNLKPIRKLAINGRNTGHLTLAWAEFSLAEVRAIRSVCNASVNDVMLSVLSGAIINYLRGLGERYDDDILRILIPVNMRLESEKDDMGNRISVLPVDVLMGSGDPLKRLQNIVEYTQVMKQSSLAKALDMVLTIPSLMPALAQPVIWSIAPAAFSMLAHTWCTNVAGPQIPMYVLGHQMLHSYGYFPINPTMGMACVVTSYNQKITMTIIADAGIVPDVTELRQYLDNSYNALRSAANVQPIAPIQIERAKPEPTTPEVQAEAPAPVVMVEMPVETPQPEAAPIEAAEAPAEAVQAEPALLTAVEMPAEAAPQPEVKPEPAPVAAVEMVAPAAEAIVPPFVPVEPIQVAQPSTNGRSEPAGVAQPVAVLSSNGRAAESADAAPPALFSERWAQAYREAINRNPAYRAVSKNWTAGSLAFVMVNAPEAPRTRAVLLDLYRGDCRGARSLSALEAAEAAAYVIEGDYRSWMDVLHGKMPPLMMIIRGKLRLKKGSLTRLLPFTQSAQELVNTAQRIS